MVEPDFLFYAVCADDFLSEVVAHETGASYPAVRDRDVFDRPISLPSPGSQKSIAGVLSMFDARILHHANALKVSAELNQVVMRRLFTRGLRGEPQKENRDRADPGKLDGQEGWARLQRSKAARDCPRDCANR